VLPSLFLFPHHFFQPYLLSPSPLSPITPGPHFISSSYLLLFIPKVPPQYLLSTPSIPSLSAGDILFLLPVPLLPVPHPHYLTLSPSPSPPSLPLTSCTTFSLLPSPLAPPPPSPSKAPSPFYDPSLFLFLSLLLPHLVLFLLIFPLPLFHSTFLLLPSRTPPHFNFPTSTCLLHYCLPPLFYSPSSNPFLPSFHPSASFTLTSSFPSIHPPFPTPLTAPNVFSLSSPRTTLLLPLLATPIPFPFPSPFFHRLLNTLPTRNRLLSSF